MKEGMRIKEQRTKEQLSERINEGGMKADERTANEETAQRENE